MSIDASLAPRPGPRPGKTRQEIVQCAIRMLDRDGHATLTFCAVARELDITVGALSRYSITQADLQDAIEEPITDHLRQWRALRKAKPQVGKECGETGVEL